jgi:hypothetical protein
MSLVAKLGVADLASADRSPATREVTHMHECTRPTSGWRDEPEAALIVPVNQDSLPAPTAGV